MLIGKVTFDWELHHDYQSHIGLRLICGQLSLRRVSILSAQLKRLGIAKHNQPPTNSPSFTTETIENRALRLFET